MYFSFFSSLTVVCTIQSKPNKLRINNPPVCLSINQILNFRKFILSSSVGLHLPRLPGWCSFMFCVDCVMNIFRFEFFRGSLPGFPAPANSLTHTSRGTPIDTNPNWCLITINFTCFSSLRLRLPFRIATAAVSISYIEDRILIMLFALLATPPHSVSLAWSSFGGSRKTFFWHSRWI